MIDFFQFFFVLLFADFGEDWSFVIFLVKMNDWIETALKIMARIKASCLVFFPWKCILRYLYSILLLQSFRSLQAKRLSIFNNIKAFYIYIIHMFFCLTLYSILFFRNFNNIAEEVIHISKYHDDDSNIPWYITDFQHLCHR